MTFAGISCGQRLDAVRGIRNLISSIFNGDGVGSCRVRDIGHCVGAVPVVLDGCVLGLALWVLSVKRCEVVLDGYFRFSRWGCEVCQSLTNQNLHSQQSLSSITGVNGELDRQACRHTSGVQTRATGTHLTGIMPGLTHDFEWAVDDTERMFRDGSIHINTA